MRVRRVLGDGDGEVERAVGTVSCDGQRSNSGPLLRVVVSTRLGWAAWDAGALATRNAKQATWREIYYGNVSMTLPVIE